jgi:hypothetical protein
LPRAALAKAGQCRSGAAVGDASEDDPRSTVPKGLAKKAKSGVVALLHAC